MVIRLGVLVVLLASAGTVQAQSLAELSRRIRADRAQRDAAGQAQPDKPPDLTKNVLTNADLYVYTIPPRPVHYERTVVYVPVPAPRREPIQRRPSSIQKWNDQLDAWRRERSYGAHWGFFPGYSPFVNTGFGPFFNTFRGVDRRSIRHRDRHELVTEPTFSARPRARNVFPSPRNVFPSPQNVFPSPRNVPR